MDSISKLRFGKELSELTVENIQLLIDNKIDESINLDYKQSCGEPQKDCDNLAAVISSFLNTEGGIIVFGVAESKEDNHCFPCKVLWINTPKEQIENLLKSRVQPYEGVTIQRIASQKDKGLGVYVIEVSKSQNPPHMFNNIYYERLNFQSKPMSHESVYRAFQTSWIQRKDIIEQVIRPLYSEIKTVVEGLESLHFEEQGPINSFYQDIKFQNRYLYDKLDLKLQEKIEMFYREVLALEPKFGFQGFLIANNIINQELAETFPDRIKIKDFEPNTETLVLDVRLSDINGDEGQRHEFSVHRALLRRIPLREYLEKELGEKVISYTPIVKTNTKICIVQFDDFWKGCEERAKKDKRLTYIWSRAEDLSDLGVDTLKKLALV
jgi:hypothetical protein